MIENEENLLLGQISPSGDIVGSLMAEKGAKGDPGEPGEPGQDGQAATIQVGTVTTGEPGTQAIVENVGTESEAIFNFTIPRGADGSGSGSGDMLKSVYDANNNGIVDNAEKVNNHTVLSDVPSDAVFTDTTYTAGTGIEIVGNEIRNTQTSANWGNITGTLSNQTDLQNALNSKANSTHTHSGNDITTGTTYYGTVGSGGASYSTVVFDNTVNIVKGDVLFIKWNIAQTGGNLKMNTNGSPSIPLMYKGSQITDNVISVGDVSEAVYDGTYFQLLSINKWIGNVNQKQDTLVSGTNIKTINNESVLGNTDIDTYKTFKLSYVDEINHIAYYKCNVGKQLIEGDSFLIKIGNVSYGDSSSSVISLDDGQNYYGIRDSESENIELSSLSNSIINFVYRTSIDYGIYFEINKDKKQDKLISGVNIKTINSQSILGSGNIDIQGGTSGDTTPVGAIISWNSLTPPTNWLICDGSYVSKTTYADLYAAIGDTYLDGGTAPAGTFRLPNYKGRTGVGYDADDTDFNAIGKKIGSKELQEHYHELGISQNVIAGANSYGLDGSQTAQATFNTKTAGTGNSGNIQPSIVEVKIIKAFQSSGVVADVAHTYTESDEDTYSCDYINGTVLFSSASGEAGNISLSSSKNNFRKLEIIFGAGSNDKIHYIVDTDSAIITLQRFYIAGNNIYGYFSTYTLEEQQLTLTGVARGTFPNNIAYDSNFNAIFKVIGYK